MLAQSYGFTRPQYVKGYTAPCCSLFHGLFSSTAKNHQRSLHYWPFLSGIRGWPMDSLYTKVQSYRECVRLYSLAFYYLQGTPNGGRHYQSLGVYLQLTASRGWYAACGWPSDVTTFPPGGHLWHPVATLPRRWHSRQSAGSLQDILGLYNEQFSVLITC